MPLIHLLSLEWNDSMHFDDRVVDAVFERALSLVILSSFDCLSPHSEGAKLTFYLILWNDMKWNDSDTVILGVNLKWNEYGTSMSMSMSIRIETTTNHNHNQYQYQYDNEGDGHWMRSRLILVEWVADIFWLIGCSQWCVFEWLACVCAWCMEMSVIWIDGCCGSSVVDLCVECLIDSSLSCPLMRLRHWYLFGSGDNMICLSLHSWWEMAITSGSTNNYEHGARPETEQQKSCENIQLGHWLDLIPYIKCSRLMWCNRPLNRVLISFCSTSHRTEPNRIRTEY